MIAALRDDFYLDEPAVRDAVRRRSTFNVIHLNTMFKVDVFVAKHDAATSQELARRQPYIPPQSPGTEIALASPEGIIVQKLYWYRLGDHVSQRQWSDAMGVLIVRGKDLDREYMHDLAAEMGVICSSGHSTTQAWTPELLHTLARRSPPPSACSGLPFRPMNPVDIAHRRLHNQRLAVTLRHLHPALCRQGCHRPCRRSATVRTPCRTYALPRPAPTSSISIT